MYEIVPLLMIVIVGLAVAVIQAQRFEQNISQLLLVSFAAHVVSALAQVWMVRYFYGGGDILGYAWMGMPLAAALRVDFTHFFPEVLKLFAHQPAALPAELPGQGSSTGSMAAVAGFLIYATGGDAYTLCAVIAIAAYFGNVALYRAFTNVFPGGYKRRLLVATMLIPSAVFWSSGFLKEGIAVAALGFVILGIEKLLRGPSVTALASIALGSIFVGLLKPYIFAGVVAGTAAWLFFKSSGHKNLLSRPVNIAVAVAVAAGGMAGLIRLFPNYTPEALSETAIYYQEMGQVVPGGSTYVLGNLGDKSFAGQLAYAPFALATALFRPLLFEARNPLVFINALETTVLLVFTVRALSRRKLMRTIAMLGELPMLGFCLVFVLIFGIGVGFMTTNLGTLSRYRMPLIPFLWALVLVLDDAVERSSSTAPAPLPTGPPPPLRERRGGIGGAQASWRSSR